MKTLIHKSITVLMIAMAPMWGFPGAGNAAEGKSPVIPKISAQEREKLESQRIDAVPIRLGEDRMLRGIVKTKEGLPATGATVVLGIYGKPIGRTLADSNGAFVFGPLKEGEYQVATRDAAAMLAVYRYDQAPEQAGSEIEVSQGAMVARGQNSGGILRNPWFWGLVIAAAIAIPLAIALADDNDDNS